MTLQRLYRRLEQIRDWLFLRRRWCLCGDEIERRFSLRCENCIYFDRR